MTCPICGKTTGRKTRPFCSKRCADLDLARWLNGSYAIPSNDPDDVEAVEDSMKSVDGDGRAERQH